MKSKMQHNEHGNHDMHNHEHGSHGTQPLVNEKIKLSDYLPLIVISCYILLLTVAAVIISGGSELEMVMSYFMGAFFILFSLFKMLDLPGFVEGYSTYDLITKRIRGYGYLYPFIELALGLLYFAGVISFGLNLFTAILMAINSAGVIIALAKKVKIHCACLGNILRVPLTKVSLFEDLLMLGMAIMMLVLAV